MIIILEKRQSADPELYAAVYQIIFFGMPKI